MGVYRLVSEDPGRNEVAREYKSILVCTGLRTHVLNTVSRLFSRSQDAIAESFTDYQIMRAVSASLPELFAHVNRITLAHDRATQVYVPPASSSQDAGFLYLSVVLRPIIGSVVVPTPTEADILNHVSPFVSHTCVSWV